MNAKNKTAFRLLIATTRLGVIALLAGLLFGQGKSADQQDRNGLPEDWTSRFVVFSNENSPPDFVLQDPRFWLQYFKHHAAHIKQSSFLSSVPGVVEDLNGRNAGQLAPGNC